MKSVYAEDFAKKASRMREVPVLIRELELNQVLIEVSKLLRLIMTIADTSANCEKWSSTLKRVNNYVMYSGNEEQLRNFVFISINKVF